MKKFSAIVKVFLISILLSVNCFADDFRYPESYMPGGEYRLFGSGRGAVSNLTGEYHETGNFAVNAGNIAINNSSYKGHYEYQQDFSDHGHEVHAPFSSSNSKIELSKKGSIDEGLKLFAVYVKGREIHPADGYDGPQGGGYPEPTGARDEYSYSFKANVTTIKVVSIEKLNQALPPERQITSEEVQKIQNGESLGDERTREIQTVGDTLNPQILGAGEAPPLVSETLGQSDLAVSHGLMFWKDVAVGIGKGAYEKIAETGNSAINSLKDGYSYWQENSLYDIATDGLAWGSEKVVNIREHYSDGVISTTIQDGKNIATGVVNSATNTYNDVKTAYQEGDGEKLGKKIGAGGVELTIAAATTKVIGAASNATKVINKADDLADAAKIEKAATTSSVYEPIYVTPKGVAVKSETISQQGTSSKVGDFRNIEGATVEEIYSRVPDNWTWEPQARGQGILFRDTDGNERVRIHGPSNNKNIPEDANSRQGWIVRISDGKIQNGSGGNYYDNNGNIGGNKSNETHIPIYGNPNAGKGNK